jgi:hypothetical protein
MVFGGHDESQNSLIFGIASIWWSNAAVVVFVYRVYAKRA